MGAAWYDMYLRYINVIKLVKRLLCCEQSMRLVEEHEKRSRRGGARGIRVACKQHAQRPSCFVLVSQCLRNSAQLAPRAVVRVPACQTDNGKCLSFPLPFHFLSPLYLFTPPPLPSLMDTPSACRTKEAGEGG